MWRSVLGRVRKLSDSSTWFLIPVWRQISPNTLVLLLLLLHELPVRSYEIMASGLLTRALYECRRLETVYMSLWDHWTVARKDQSSGSDQEVCWSVVISKVKTPLECHYPRCLCSSPSTFHWASRILASLARFVSKGSSLGCFLAESFFQKSCSICLEEADQREGISGRGSGMSSSDTRGCRGIRRLCALKPLAEPWA